MLLQVKLSRLNIPEDLNQIINSVQYNEVTDRMKKMTGGLQRGERPCNQKNTKPSTTNAAWETEGGKNRTKAPRHNLPGTTPAVRGHSHLDAKRMQSQAARVQFKVGRSNRR
jgi:hypothetical protein